MSVTAITAYVGHYVSHRQHGGSPNDYATFNGLPIRTVNKLEKEYQKYLRAKAKARPAKASDERTRRVSARASA